MPSANLTPFQESLPSNGPEREALRVRGQFWTPDWVAQAMVAYVVSNGSDHIFDPAVGSGAFFRAAQSLAAGQGNPGALALLGAEIDPAALLAAQQSGLSADDLAHVRLADFILDPPEHQYRAIVANPPYVRHHRLQSDFKAQLKRIARNALGIALDGRAGLHVYFLIRGLQLLAPGGRLCFIMPADTCEGVFAADLWEWITQNYRLNAVVTFDPQASPFPKIDTNPLIFMLERSAPADSFLWVRCKTPGTWDLKEWVLTGMQGDHFAALEIQKRQVREGLNTGLSRPMVATDQSGATLGDLARVTRGIATGANDFFLLTRQQALDLELPDRFLRLALGRTRDVNGDTVTVEDIDNLDRTGRPTLLLSLPDQPLNAFPVAVQRYLDTGERLGLPRRSLISTRRPWYKMEVRTVPPILFAYLGRRNARFIRNRALALPLTGFLCVYPRNHDENYLEKLWALVSHPLTLANLRLVGKSYGAAAIKVEPRALERLPLPQRVLDEVGLQVNSPTASNEAVQLPLGDFYTMGVAT